MFYRIMAVVILAGTVSIAIVAGIGPAVMYFMLQVSLWSFIHFGEVLFHSVILERMYKRDRLLADYVPAREGNWWLVLGLAGLLCWSAWGYSALAGDAPLGAALYVVPSVILVFGLSYGRAFIDRKAFRVQVELARDASLDRRFWDIVNNDKEA
jgi:hypothetical protein